MRQWMNENSEKTELLCENCGLPLGDSQGNYHKCKMTENNFILSSGERVCPHCESSPCICGAWVFKKIKLWKYIVPFIVFLIIVFIIMGFLEPPENHIYRPAFIC